MGLILKAGSWKGAKENAQTHSVCSSPTSWSPGRRENLSRPLRAAKFFFQCLQEQLEQGCNITVGATPPFPRGFSPNFSLFLSFPLSCPSSRHISGFLPWGHSGSKQSQIQGQSSERALPFSEVSLEGSLCPSSCLWLYLLWLVFICCG